MEIEGYKWMANKNIVLFLGVTTSPDEVIKRLDAFIHALIGRQSGTTVCAHANVKWIKVQINGIPTKYYGMQGKEDGTLIEAESLLTILGGENSAIAQERNQGTIPIAPRWMSTQEQRGIPR
jgi:hypothetical protein